MIEVMLDLETMSSKRNAAICAIGAVKMDLSVLDRDRAVIAGNPEDLADESEPKPFIVDTYYAVVSLRSCQQFGLHVDGDTVMWWLTQSEEARKALCPTGDVKDLDSLRLALLGFSAWFGPTSLPVWGNGSDFDNVILSNAYDAAELKPPWKYSHSRCYRTAKADAPKVFEPAPNPLKHHALEDARWQAEHLRRILAHRGWAL